MQTEKKAGTDRFKFMLEFPNKVRVYATDEEMLSKILEKSGISSEVKAPIVVSLQLQPIEKGELIQSRLESRCDDYGNTSIVSEDEQRKPICGGRDPQKQADGPQELNTESLSGDRTNEDRADAKQQQLEDARVNEQERGDQFKPKPTEESTLKPTVISKRTTAYEEKMRQNLIELEKFQEQIKRAWLQYTQARAETNK